MHQNVVQFQPNQKIEPFSWLFHSLFGIFMGFLKLNIKCVYVTIAKDVYTRSHLSAINFNMLANVFVSVDTITLYLLCTLS